MWATLVPDKTNLRVNASIAGSASTIDLVAMVDNEVRYISAQRPPGPTTGDISGLKSVVVSPDAKTIYGVDPNSNAVLVVNAADLTQRQLFKNGDVVEDAAGQSVTLDIKDPVDVNVSVDGENVYIADSGTGQILIFQRDVSKGNLTFFGFDNIGTPHVHSIISSDDGAFAFASDDYLDVFSRDATTGALSSSDYLSYSTPGTLAVSHDGNLLLKASGNQVAVYDTSSLASTPQTFTDGDIVTDVYDQSSAVSGLAGASSVAVSADDQFVYVTAADDNAVTVFQRVGDSLTLLQTVVNGTDGVRGILGASCVAVIPGGKYVVVSGQDNNSLAVFQVDQRPDTAG